MSYPQGVCLRGCEGKHREDFQRGHRSCPLFAACEGEEGGERERCHPRRRREVGALFAPVGQRRVPHGGANGDGHHNGEALAAPLDRGGGPAKRARTLASLSLAWKAARGPRGGESYPSSCKAVNCCSGFSACTSGIPLRPSIVNREQGQPLCIDYGCCAPLLDQSPRKHRNPPMARLDQQIGETA